MLVVVQQHRCSDQWDHSSGRIGLHLHINSLIGVHAGDAAMQLVVSQLVFASSTGETTEILNDRRKVMVMPSL